MEIYDDLITVINAMAERKHELKSVRATMQQAPQWQEENLLQNYIQFIER